jgi:hypothetical protein
MMAEVFCSDDASREGGSDSNWLDVLKAKILVASSSDKSGFSNGQTTKAVTPHPPPHPPPHPQQ